MSRGRLGKYGLVDSAGGYHKYQYHARDEKRLEDDVGETPPKR